MYLTRTLLVLVVILGSLDIWAAEGSKPPRTTRPSKTTSTTKKIEEVTLGEDNKHYHPKPSRFPTLKPSHYPSQLPTIRPSLPPPPPQQYPVPTQGPSHPPPHQQGLIGGPSYYPPHHPAVSSSYAPPQFTTAPSYHPTHHPTPTQYPIGYPSHPPPSPQPTPQEAVLDQFDNRYPDGSYEFRYELPDATVRYERGYFVLYQHKRILVVKGYYSYRLPDRRYHTVFYTADQFGYRQDSAAFSINRPTLPRSLKVDVAAGSNELRNSEVPTSTPADTTLASQ